MAIWSGGLVVRWSGGQVASDGLRGRLVRAAPCFLDMVYEDMGRGLFEPYLGDIFGDVAQFGLTQGSTLMSVCTHTYWLFVDGVSVVPGRDSRPAM